MKKLVLGTTKTVVVPAILKEKQPSIDALNVTPSTSAQTITAPSGTDGYSPVNVSAVTSSIDANIQAGNIKDGVTILGVTGNYQGGGSAPAYYIEKVVDGNGNLTAGTTMFNWVGVKKVSQPYAFSHAYDSSTISGHITVGDKTEAYGSYCFTNMFTSCNSMTSLKISIEKLLGTSCMQGFCSTCPNLVSVDWDDLKSVTGNNTCWSVFNSCSRLKTVSLNGLEEVTVLIAPSYGQMFSSCVMLESVSFGGLKSSTFSSRQDQIQYLFNNSTGSTATGGCTVHFPSNFDPSDPNHTFDASTLTGYPTFGGNANYIHVAFDLPATE